MATETAKLESTYAAAFRDLQGVHESQGFWLKRLRENAMNCFEELGFPSVKEEEWKYTNVAPIGKIDFTPSSSFTDAQSDFTVDQLTRFHFSEAAQSQLVFVNGILQTDLSSVAGLPEGVVLTGLSQALSHDRYSEIVRRYLARIADYVQNGFTALNTAFISEGAFVYVPRNVSVELPLHLLFASDGLRSKVASFPRILIVAEDHSKATVIESYAGLKADSYFTNAVVEVVLGDGARVDHYKIQRESTEAFHVATTAADLGPNSSYDTTAVTLGAELSRNDISVLMDHEGAECWVDGLYIVNTGQHTDTHSVIDHRQPHCTSHQIYKGILDGKSRAVFNGKIFVRHDAQKTDAIQTNKNLLLSNEARVDTKPQLEILADDVKCAHGAAVGQIDEDELFYLKTRGIHPDLARNLLTYGFAEEVIGKIKVGSIRSQLDAVVLNRLNARLEA